MIHVLRIAHLRIAPQEGNLEVGNCDSPHIIKSEIFPGHTVTRKSVILARYKF